MKRLLLAALLATACLLGSCQCADPPEVPPVEEAGAQQGAANAVSA